MYTSIESYLYVAISSGISILSCLLMLYLYHRFPSIQRLDGSKHIYALQAFDLIVCLFVVIPTPLYKDSSICILQAFGKQAFTVSGVLWTGFISLEFYMRFYIQGRPLSIKTALLVCIGTGLISGIIPLTFDGYSHNGEWCAVNLSKNSTTIVLLFVYVNVYGIIWVVMSWNIFMYAIVIKKYKEIAFERPGELFLITRLKLYPIVLFVCYLPITVSGVLQTIGKANQQIELVASVLLRLLGFCNAVVYGYSPEIKKMLFSSSARTQKFTKALVNDTASKLVSSEDI